MRQRTGQRKSYSMDGEYSPEQLAWLKACDAYRKRLRRRWLDAVDYLEVAKGFVAPAAEGEAGSRPTG